MEEDSKAFTTFTVGPLGFYKCESMPFVLTNAPATFQQLMQSCLGNLHLHYCIIYHDDVIVFSKTPEEHVFRLRAVFEKHKQVGLKLKPSKCELFRQALSIWAMLYLKMVYKPIPRRWKPFTSASAH